MTDNAPNWFVTQYPDRVMHIYQNKGFKLRPMVTPAVRIVDATTARFRLAGVSKAYKKGRNQRNIPSGGDRKVFDITLQDWTVFDTVEEYDLDRMNTDERETVYTAGAMALGRATDIELYAKMYAKTGTSVTGLDFSAGAFSAVSALTLCSALQNDKVPWDGQVYCGLPSLSWNQFLGNKVVNDAQQVGGDLPFTKATDTRFWNGVNWFLQVEQDTGDFYPSLAGNTVDGLIWHKTAVGWSNHTDLRVIPQWDNYEDWWTINMRAKGAATAELQNGLGIKRFRLSTNSAIAII